MYAMMLKSHQLGTTSSATHLPLHTNQRRTSRYLPGDELRRAREYQQSQNEMVQRANAEAAYNAYADYARREAVDELMNSKSNKEIKRRRSLRNPRNGRKKRVDESIDAKEGPVRFHLSSESSNEIQESADGNGSQVNVSTLDSEKIGITASAPSSRPSTPGSLQRNGFLNGSSSESAIETVEAVLGSLRRSLRKQNCTLATPEKVSKVSVALKHFDPAKAYNKLKRRYAKDAHSLVEEMFVTFEHISELLIGRKSVRVTDLDCCSYFFKMRILHECRSLGFQRPKKKPLQEYYNDDDAELEGKCLICDYFAFFIKIKKMHPFTKITTLICLHSTLEARC